MSKFLKYFFTFFLALFFAGKSTYAQQIDSIFFHLYTDSLKKGTFNYINVDGKLNNGSWLPLTTQHIELTSSAGKFEGNSLVLDKSFTMDSVVITATLKSNNQVKKSVTIYVKKLEENEKLKTTEEILKEMQNRKPKKA